jgi:hypothetical protein
MRARLELSQAKDGEKPRHMRQPSSLAEGLRQSDIEIFGKEAKGEADGRQKTLD